MAPGEVRLLLRVRVMVRVRVRVVVRLWRQERFASYSPRL